MKKLTLYVMTLGLSFIVLPFQSTAQTSDVSSSASVSKPEEIQHLLVRLDDINKMNKSKLSSPERSKLHSEVRSIRDRLEKADGGVYLSVGAIIIIILLLVILF